MKKIFLLLLLFPVYAIAVNKANDFPIKEWTSTGTTPFIFYISGDGGFNDFSNDLCTAIHNTGYSVTSLNAKSYFWDKKTPEETTTDLVNYLNKQFKGRRNHQLILIGYSFGADVMPFIVNRLPDSLRKNIVSVQLLSPSTSTDFEIHWLELLGASKKRNMDVVAEINKLGAQKTITVFGSNEDDFPVKQVTLKNYTNETLPGGHHFGSDTGELTKVLMKYFK